MIEIPRSTYYQSLQKVESNRECENKELTKRIVEIHTESKQRYGAPKIHNLLKKEGYLAGLKRVQRLISKANVCSIMLKKFRPTSSKQKVEERENLLKRDFTTNTINEKWVADITYINTLRNGWCYLASIMDLHSKKIIGYSFSRTMTTELVIKAFKKTYKTQNPVEGVILYTDLGSQYTNEKLKKCVQSMGIKQSFSHKGYPYYNACMESFHAVF